MDELQAELRELGLQASYVQHLIDHGPGNEDDMGGNVGDGDGEDSDILDGILCLGEAPVRLGNLGLIDAVILFLFSIA